MIEKEIEKPYWEKDVTAFEMERSGGVLAVRFRLHQAWEKYWDRSNEIIPLPKRPGERLYFHAKPYIPYGRGFMSQQPIGQAQAWFYPESRDLILWECYLSEWVRGKNPLEDKLLQGVWDGWEKYIISESRGVKRIITPSWEPIYDDKTWKEFLGAKGYQHLNHKAYAKPIKKQG